MLLIEAIIVSSSKGLPRTTILFIQANFLASVVVGIFSPSYSGRTGIVISYFLKLSAWLVTK